jgi:pyruvate formate lyase activating enzyme
VTERQKDRLTLITDVRRNALDDGPGIRSTIFFKGCVLSCVWCQNPETLSPRQQLQRQGGLCIGCEQCAGACPEQAVTFLEGDQRRHDEEVCRLCGACTEACPPAALRIVGRAVPPAQLAEELLEDEPFFRNSGGGVTFSGGEPTMHLDYLAELAGLLRQRGVHLLLQTCGLYRTEPFEQALLPLLDLIYFDVKLVDEDLHRRYTGASNRQILSNLERLTRRVPDLLLPRVPLVPGITDGEENLRAIARLLVRLGLPRVALLPYNPLWIPKRRELQLELPYGHERFMESEEIERCRRLLIGEGLAVE